jgi:hypothetical protein
MDNGRKPDARVTIRIPADAACVALLRTAAGHATRLDLALDDIEARLGPNGSGAISMSGRGDAG